ncbi:MAG: phage holin family protein [Actinomycetota bacterium]|nr:phage holin family protein [Actinomycetota bacterium]
MLMEFLVKTVVNGLALWLAALIVPGITFGRGASWSGTLLIVALVAVIFGLLNAVIKPALRLLSLPLIVLSLGLFSLVINALMLVLTSWLADKLGLAFHVEDFFWDAVLGGIVVTFASLVINAVIPDRRRR